MAMRGGGGWRMNGEQRGDPEEANGDGRTSEGRNGCRKGGGDGPEAEGTRPEEWRAEEGRADDETREDEARGGGGSRPTPHGTRTNHAREANDPRTGGK